MITLSGKLLNIVNTETKDPATGEITKTHTAEFLHQQRGRSVVDSVKLDTEVLIPWTKVIGSDISVEVRFYAMKTREGSINSGLTLADKKCLPLVHNFHQQKQPA